MNKKALVIVGGAATGKTTLARKIAGAAGSSVMLSANGLMSDMILRNIMGEEPSTIIVDEIRGSGKLVARVKDILACGQLWASRKGAPGGFLVPTPNMILITNDGWVARHIGGGDPLFNIHWCGGVPSHPGFRCVPAPTNSIFATGAKEPLKKEARGRRYVGVRPTLWVVALTGAIEKAKTSTAINALLAELSQVDRTLYRRSYAIRLFPVSRG